VRDKRSKIESEENKESLVLKRARHQEESVCFGNCTSKAASTVYRRKSLKSQRKENLLSLTKERKKVIFATNVVIAFL
jgi:hypothetical protein